MFRLAIFLSLPFAHVPAAQQTASPASAAQVETDNGEPFELGPGIVAPTRLVTPSPVYPKEALASGVAGTVVLSVRVEKDGTFSHVTVVKGLGHGLDEVAQQTVSRWLYKPATKDGKPVAVHALIKVTFKIEE